MTFAQRLGQLNPEYKAKFLIGINDQEVNYFIITPPEYYTLNQLVFQFVYDDYIYEVWDADIHDDTNNVFTHGYYVTRSTHPAQGRPLYAIDTYGSQQYRTALLLPDSAVVSLFTSFFEATKNKTLFYQSFEIRDVMFLLQANYRSQDTEIVGSLENIFKGY